MQTLRITRLPLFPAPSAAILCTVGYKLASAPTFIILSNAVQVLPNGNLPIPFDISGLDDVTEYDVLAKSNCGKHVKIERVLTLGPGITTTTTTLPITTTTTTVPLSTTTSPIPPPEMGTVCLDFNWGGVSYVTIQDVNNPSNRQTINANFEIGCRSDIEFGTYEIVEYMGGCPSPLASVIIPGVGSTFTLSPGSPSFTINISCV